MRINYPTTPEKNIAALKVKEAIENIIVQNFISLSDFQFLTEIQKDKIYSEAHIIIERLADKIDYNPESKAV